MQIHSKKSCSYIGRDESVWIKGFLTFLIVLGHNMTFTLPLNKWGVMSYLYTFHVHGFFLLPFLYGSSPLTIGRVLRQAVRLYWPFFILATAMTVVFGLFTHFEHFSCVNLLKLYTCSGIASLRIMCGYMALWFLPVMFVVLVLKDVYYGSDRFIRSLLMWSSLFLHAYAWAGYWLALPVIPDYLFVPVTALRYLSLGVCCRAIMAWVNGKRAVPVFAVCLFLFVCGTIVYIEKVSTQIINGDNIWFASLQVWMPVVFMVLLCKALDIWKIRRDSLWVKIGRCSLPVYIISPFMGYAFYFLLLRLDGVDWWTGIGVQFAIVGLAYTVSDRCLKGTRMERFLFPKSLEELRMCMKRKKN